MPRIWTYSDWSGPLMSLGGDEWFRRTVVARLPFTTFALVVAVSAPGKLYDPLECPEPNFERWMRTYRRAGR